MQTRTVARLGAVLFVAIAIAAAAVDRRERPAPGRDETAFAPKAAAVDPLRGELMRCQAIGQAGAGDMACLRAWAENRRRFLGADARPMARLPDAGAEPAATSGHGGSVAASAASGEQ